MASTRRCALCAATAESRRSRVPRRSYANDAPTGASKSERERACARARARARSEGESSPTPSAASSASSAVTPTRMRSTSVAGATSAHATPSGRRLAAPASKYAARRSSVADFRMRSASPAPTNVGSPFASTVFRASEARVTPSANGSGSAAGSEDEGSEDEGSEARDALEEGVSSESPEVARRSPSRRRWTRSTVTSRFPRTVSINPAYRPLFSSGFTSVSFASASEASLFLAAANHRRSPSSTSALRRRRRLLPPPRAFLHGERLVGLGEPGDDVHVLHARDDGVLPERRPRDLERELAHDAALDAEGEAEGVERLDAEADVAQDDVAREHRHPEVPRADAVRVRAEHVVQHGRELTLEHRASAKNQARPERTADQTPDEPG